MFRLICFAAAWFGLSVAATAQTAPAPYADVIRVAGEVERFPGAVAEGQAVLRFPYEYRRTGRLLNDMQGSGQFALGTIYAAAGAPGFVVAELGATRTSMQPMWCFLRPGGDGPDDLACSYGELVFQFGNPLLVESTEYSSYQNRATVPQIEEGPISLPFPLVIEYRFLRWTGDWLVLELRAGGERVGPYRVAREGNGATLRTVAGALRFERVGRETRVSVIDEVPAVTAAPLAPAPGAAVIESAFIASDMPPPAADFAPIARNAHLLTQTVRPGPAMRMLSAPRNNEDRYGGPGAILFPAMRGAFPILCWQRDPPEFSNWSVSWIAQCLEDPDHDGDYDVIWPNVDFLDGRTFFISSFALAADRVREAVRVEPAPDAAQPTARVTLVYLGPSAERRNASGELEATAVEFDWRLGLSPAGSRFSIPIEGGAGVIRLPDGTTFGELRNVQPSGAAEFKLTGGFPQGRISYLSGRVGP